MIRIHSTFHVQPHTYVGHVCREAKPSDSNKSTAAAKRARVAKGASNVTSHIVAVATTLASDPQETAEPQCRADQRSDGGPTLSITSKAASEVNEPPLAPSAMQIPPGAVEAAPVATTLQNAARPSPKLTPQAPALSTPGVETHEAPADGTAVSASEAAPMEQCPLAPEKDNVGEQAWRITSRWALEGDALICEG
jgi:hypothetical protein